MENSSQRRFPMTDAVAHQENLLVPRLHFRGGRVVLGGPCISFGQEDLELMVAILILLGISVSLRPSHAGFFCL